MEPSKELDELAHAVIGAAIEVHRNLEPGFLESVYEQALEIEFKLRAIPFERQKELAVSYKGHQVGKGFLDLLVADSLVLELKAVDKLAQITKPR